MTRQSASYYRLLGDLSDVPDEYIRDVSHMKRFLERWTMDPKYQADIVRALGRFVARYYGSSVGEALSRPVKSLRSLPRPGSDWT